MPVSRQTMPQNHGRDDIRLRSAARRGPDETAEVSRPADCSLVHHQAAADVDGGTADETGVLGCQEDCYCRHLFGVAHAA